jgi:hypothetical protein
MPLKLRDGSVILKISVVKIESLTGRKQNYGNVTGETLFRCTVVEKCKTKLKLTDSVLEKK